MLTGLKIDATLTETGKTTSHKLSWTFDSQTLITYLQQALPGVKVSAGLGTRVSPWSPSTPAEWFYCSKLKSGKRFPNIDRTGKAWLKVGGRYIAIDPANFYASDYGSNGQIQVIEKPTYPNLRSEIDTWKKNVQNSDAGLTNKIRDLLAGKPVKGAPAPDWLPVMTVVLFFSEVARNHTAFHTNLMAMDLIEGGKSLDLNGTSVAWTWQNAIWMTDACPNCGATGQVNCSVCHGTGGRRYTCQKCKGYGSFGHGPCGTCHGRGWVVVDRCQACRGTGAARCGRCNGRGRGTLFDERYTRGYQNKTNILLGGSAGLQNGLLPMSHKDSAFGSAFDMTGKGQYNFVKGGSADSRTLPAPLSVVRRKEATVLIQWLATLLDDTKIQFSPRQELALKASGTTANIQLTGMNFGKAYDEVDGISVARSKGDSVVKDIDSDIKDTVRQKILSYFQIRCEYFWYAFAPVS